jgi:hypothetical protein
MAVLKYASTSVSSSFSSVGTCAPKDKQLLHGSKEDEAMLVSYMYNSHVIAAFMPKPSTHRMQDPGSIVPYIRPKVLTDNQML